MSDTPPRSLDMLTDGGVNYMIQASNAEIAFAVVDGHAGALDFVLGLTDDPEGWNLLRRLHAEKPDLRGIRLWEASRREGQVMAIARHPEVTFSEIALRLLDPNRAVTTAAERGKE